MDTTARNKKMMIKYQPKPFTEVAVLKCPDCNSPVFVKTLSDGSKDGICNSCSHDFSNKEDK